MKTIIGIILLPLGLALLIMAYVAFAMRDVLTRPFQGKKEIVSVVYAIADFLKATKGDEKRFIITTTLLAALGVLLTGIAIVLIKA